MAKPELVSGFVGPLGFPPDAMLIEGTRGKYEALVRFADDELGESWLARDEASGFVRVTRLDPGRAARAPEREKFVELVTRAMAATSDRVLVPIDRGESEGAPFAVHRHRHGVSLAKLLGALHARGRRLAPEVSVAIVLAILEALDSVHDTTGDDGQPLCLVHGAIRSERIVITFDGDVVLTGLGLRADFTRDDDATREARRSAAPETLRGEAIDTRADIHALAAVLFEALTMRRFDRALLSQPLSALVPEASESLVDTLAEALTESSGLRPPTLDELRGSLLEASPKSADVPLGELAVLVRTIVSQDVSRGPIANTPSLAAELERGAPAPDPSVLDALTLPTVPGTPADFEEKPGKRSVFGAPQSPTNRAARPVESKPLAPRPSPFSTPNRGASPSPNAAAVRPARKSVPPPRASKSTPPPPPRPPAAFAASAERSTGPTVPARQAPAVAGPSPAWSKSAPKVPPAMPKAPPAVPPSAPAVGGGPIRTSTPPPPPPHALSKPPPPPPPSPRSPSSTLDSVGSPASAETKPSAPRPSSVPPPAFAPLPTMVDPSRPFAPISLAPPPVFDPSSVPASEAAPTSEPSVPASNAPIDMSSLFGVEPSETPSDAGASPLDVSSIAPPRPHIPVNDTTGAMRIATLNANEEPSMLRRYAPVAVVALLLLVVVGLGVMKLSSSSSGSGSQTVDSRPPSPAATAAPPAETAVPAGAAAPTGGESPSEAAPTEAADSDAAHDEPTEAESAAGRRTASTTRRASTTTPRTETTATMTATSRPREENLSFRERRRLRRARRRN